MPKKADGQLELVFENRHLLVVFFVIVGLCGVFFSLGYIVGRNTLSSVVRVTQAAAGIAEPSNKPSPMPPAAFAKDNPQNQPAAEANAEQSAPATDLNFYQTVEGKTPEAKLVPSEPSGAAPGTATPPAAGATPAAQEKAAPSQPVPAPPVTAAPAQTMVAQTAPSQAPPAFMVQVSALTRREDANTLVELLKDKKLPVQVTAGGNDSLFHVMVGPYQNQKDAEHAKSLLEQDGFRPMVKRQ